MKKVKVKMEGINTKIDLTGWKPGDVLEIELPTGEKKMWELDRWEGELQETNAKGWVKVADAILRELNPAYFRLDEEVRKELGLSKYTGKELRVKEGQFRLELTEVEMLEWAHNLLEKGEYGKAKWIVERMLEKKGYTLDIE